MNWWSDPCTCWTDWAIVSYEHLKNFSHWSQMKFFRCTFETIAWIVQQVPGSFLEFIINIVIVISQFNLFVTSWIINELGNVWESVSQPGRNYHYQYKCTKERNVSFSSLVNLEFLVIETFILSYNGRTFFSSLDSANFNSTTEQLVRHLISSMKVLSVSICEKGKLLLCMSGMF